MIIHTFDFEEDGVGVAMTARYDPDGTITILEMQDYLSLTIDGEYEDITNKQFSLVEHKTTGEVTASIKINGKDITNKRALPGSDK